MSKQKQRARKKKERERVGQKKVLQRRTAKRKKTSRDKELDKEMMSNMPKLEPFMREDTKKRKEEEMKENIKNQLEHNMAVLEALEKEYDKEQGDRDDLTKELESKGMFTVEQKLKYVEDKVKRQQAELQKIESTQAGHFTYESSGGMGGLKN